jgi:L-rhamnose-H+ transport protein
MAKVPAAGGAAALASFAVWPLVLMGGSVVNIAYSVYLLSRNRTWGNFAYGFKEGFNPVLAGCLWMGGNALFSSGAGLLGVLGLSVGFAIFTIITIGCRQVAAVFTGEWHRMQANIYRSFAGGLACLFLAVLTIGASNYLGK